MGLHITTAALTGPGHAASDAATALVIEITTLLAALNLLQFSRWK